MDIMKILENIEVTEEQEQALIKAVEAITEAKAKKVKKECKDEVGKTKKDCDAKIKDYKGKAKKAFELYGEDCKKAFELYGEDCKKAFDLFEKDAKKAFAIHESDMKREYGENMVTALQELYVECQEKVKVDLLASPEFAVVEELRKKVAGALSPETKAAMEELETYKARAQKAEDDKAELEREKLIDSLCEDIPMAYRTKVKDFVSKAKDTDGIFENFNAIASVIITDAETKKENFVAANEDVNSSSDKKITTRTKFARKNIEPSARSVKDNNRTSLTPVFESVSVPSVNQGEIKDKGRFNKGFSEFESKLLNKYVFPAKSN